MDPVVAEIAEGFQTVHSQLRDEVRGCSPEELNWKPAPETNSIAVLVVHTLGSEAEVLRVAANVPGERDRPSEFRATATNGEQLLKEIDQADSYLEALAPRITAEDLAAERPRGDRPAQPCLRWLLNNYGHAREHLAHIQLTRQLYAQTRSQSG